MTCKKAQGYLESNIVPVKSRTDASKERQGRAQALALAKAAAKVVVAKGKKVTVFDMKKDSPDDDTLAGHLLGPTGNLRAPTARIGNTLLVGYAEEMYKNFLEA
jgi:arsenate reductase-like glutaredoxin family protein